MMIEEILEKTKKASYTLATLDGEAKNRALLKMSEEIEKHAEEILFANKADVEKYSAALGEVMTDRLRLTSERIAAMAQGIREVAALPDPVGETLEEISRPNGLKIKKVSVPLGVVAIIYESRPNVTSDAAALCFKSGNACILRAGKEAFGTSRTIIKILKNAVSECGICPDVINMPENSDRENVTAIMNATNFVDILIPRGGKSLIDACVNNSKVPCIQTGTGICHVYVDKYADLKKALDIVNNAKTSRPSVCNAEEVCLVHKDIAKKFLPALKTLLTDERIKDGKTPVKLIVDEKAAKIIDGIPADEKSFDTEFLDYILAIKIVASTEDAIAHIAEHSTHHSDAIVTESREEADKFTLAVDSAAVYVNVSTRFTDGGEFGKGCEIGISTQKMHARGPMGLKELTSYKYIVTGDGQIR